MISLVKRKSKKNTVSWLENLTVNVLVENQGNLAEKYQDISLSYEPGHRRSVT